MGALSSVSSLISLIFFLKFLRVKLSLWGPPYFLISRGRQVPPLAPPCGRPWDHVHVYLLYMYIQHLLPVKKENHASNVSTGKQILKVRNNFNSHVL